MGLWAFDDDLAVDGVGYSAKVLSVLELRIADAIRRSLHLVRAHPMLLQQVLQLVGVASGRPCPDDDVQLAPPGQALVGGQTGEVGAPDEPAQAHPLGVVGADDGDPLIARRIARRVDAVRREATIVVAGAAHVAAVDGVIEEGGREQLHGRLRLRHVDVLSSTGATGVVDSGERGQSEEAGRHVVGVGHERPGGRHDRASR